MGKAETKILKITNMIYARDGCDSDMTLKAFLKSSHPAEYSAAILAIDIYNFLTNSEFDEDEFISE